MGRHDILAKSVYGKDPETGRYKTTYERTALTEALPVNDAGIVETKIKIENMDLGNMRLVGVAKVRSPFSDFEMKRETSAVGIRIYKGEELEGNLSKSLIIGRIPLSTLVSFKSASTANSDALAPPNGSSPLIMVKLEYAFRHDRKEKCKYQKDRSRKVAL